MFFKKIPPISKIPRSEKVRTFKNSSFNTKFRVFQKIPPILKIPRSEKVRTFQKSRLFQQNMIHRHKHLFFPNAFWYICHSLPHLTSKSCRIHAFNRTISMFDINYRDQKVLCITNLIPVGRPRTNFRTF